MIGRMLGAYEIKGVLGEGGVSTVFWAEHFEMGQRAAIKMIKPEFARNEKVVARFLREAEVTSRIRHPGIVTVFDLGYHTSESPYLIMELLDGESLRQRIGRIGRIPRDQALAIARHIASALAAAHRSGVVHRDLKPGNIMLVRDPAVPFSERPKVVDFGIAKLMEPYYRNHVPAQPSRLLPLTDRGKVLGTVSYMAPEQCLVNTPVDHRADLYALGCVLFHMLCGRPPFVGPAHWVMCQQVEVQPPSPREIDPAHESSVDPAIDALILRLLAKNPAVRPQSAGEVIAELDALMPQGKSPEASPAPCPPSRSRLLPTLLVLWAILVTSALLVSQLV